MLGNDIFMAVFSLGNDIFTDNFFNAIISNIALYVRMYVYSNSTCGLNFKSIPVVQEWIVKFYRH